MTLRAVLFFAFSALCVAVPAHAKLRSAAMRLPAELNSAERHAVSGRQGWRHLQYLEFADVRAANLQRSTTKGGDLGILFYRGSKRRQTFSFSLTVGPGTPWQISAATNLRRRAAEIDGFAVEVRNDSGFAATLQPGEPGAAWTLEMSEKSEQPLQGWLRRGSELFLVKGTDRLAGTPLPLGETSGYVFEWNGRPVAAVEVLGDGAVWFASDLPPSRRAAVAAAASALLLLEELRPTLPN
jgi:hypothetical protein